MDKRSIVAMILLVTLSVAWIKFHPWLCQKMHWDCGNEQPAVSTAQSNPPPGSSSSPTSSTSSTSSQPATAIAATRNIAPATAPVVAVANAATQNISAAPSPGVNSIKGSIATRPVVVGSTQFE